MARSSSAEHVVIIGGGATSALIAVRLAERGFRVTVLGRPTWAMVLPAALLITYRTIKGE
ncbi:MAG: hypothetical protein E6I93_16845 [Chloroflexi bacterium]|nr:MAG: hypothetical protein E6I93_16845 [Chloroflexota bacterium]